MKGVVRYYVNWILQIGSEQQVRLLISRTRPPTLELSTSEGIRAEVVHRNFIHGFIPRPGDQEGRCRSVQCSEIWAVISAPCISWSHYSQYKVGSYGSYGSCEGAGSVSPADTWDNVNYGTSILYQPGRHHELGRLFSRVVNETSRKLNSEKAPTGATKLITDRQRSLQLPIYD